METAVAVEPDRRIISQLVPYDGQSYAGFARRGLSVEESSEVDRVDKKKSSPSSTPFRLILSSFPQILDRLHIDHGHFQYMAGTISLDHQFLLCTSRFCDCLRRYS